MIGFNFPLKLRLCNCYTYIRTHAVVYLLTTKKSLITKKIQNVCWYKWTKRVRIPGSLTNHSTFRLIRYRVHSGDKLDFKILYSFAISGLFRFCGNLARTSDWLCEQALEVLCRGIKLRIVHCYRGWQCLVDSLCSDVSSACGLLHRAFHLLNSLSKYVFWRLDVICF